MNKKKDLDTEKQTHKNYEEEGGERERGGVEGEEGEEFEGDEEERATKVDLDEAKRKRHMNQSMIMMNGFFFLFFFFF